MFEPVYRYFYPKQTHTLKERCLPFIGKVVTVTSWHSNYAVRETHPEDDLVGFVEEFSADIPKSELLTTEPKDD